MIGGFREYADAERVVDRLSDAGFPVEHTAIVGRGLSSVEQVTGRMTTLRAAGQSALSGAIIGALFGWLFGAFNWINPLVSGLLLALYGALFGAVLGAVLGAAGHAMTGGRRDFSSVAGMRAESYEVLVSAHLADEARRLIGGAPAPRADSPAPAPRPTA
ncbi:glycine zipper family protein [Saccharothrix syringae]|uniref:Glycine zipper family protein n=1 Tax=Saccharothrix syringae TaxID=103733 RepID=A0A5Q0HFC4_SACSY|nr:glycine zipper family protein [Saccharothrix syringae]